MTGSTDGHGRDETVAAAPIGSNQIRLAIVVLNVDKLTFD